MPQHSRAGQQTYRDQHNQGTFGFGQEHGSGHSCRKGGNP
jgi:hypothetical protein